MSKNMMIGAFKGALKVCKQWDRKDAMATMLPAEVKDGKVLNAKGGVIGSFEDVDDTTIFDGERLLKSTRITEKLQHDIYTPVEQFLAMDEKEEAPVSEVDEIEGIPEEIKEDVKANVDLIDIVETIEDLVEAGEIKKAKKLLKAHKEALHKKQVKALKKLIKGDE